MKETLGIPSVKVISPGKLSTSSKPPTPVSVQQTTFVPPSIPPPVVNPVSAQQLPPTYPNSSFPVPQQPYFNVPTATMPMNAPPPYQVRSPPMSMNYSNPQPPQSSYPLQPSMPLQPSFPPQPPIAAGGGAMAYMMSRIAAVPLPAVTTAAPTMSIPQTQPQQKRFFPNNGIY